MSYKVNAHEMFWLDLAEARIYYESIAFDLGNNFYIAFEKAYDKLIKKPDAYFNLSKKIRRISLPNFPYQIMYTFQNQTIFIWCLHHAFSSKKTWIERSR